MQPRTLDPFGDRGPSRLGDLELHRPLRLLLKDDRALGDMVAMGNVPHPKSNQVACSQLAVDRQVEQGQIADSSLKLQSNSDGPDVSKPQGCLLAD